MKLLHTSSIFLAAAILVTGSCGPAKNKSRAHADEVAFLEYYVTIDGRALQGTPPPGMRIDGPTYMFNSEGRAITSYINPSINTNQATAILGIGRILRGAAGGGLSSRLVGIPKLPYSEGSLTILELKNGVAKCHFLDENFTVGVGHSFQKEFETTDSIPYEREMTIIQRKIIHQFTFHGYIPRDSLLFPSNE